MPNFILLTHLNDLKKNRYLPPVLLKGTATLIISMFNLKELSEPWILIPVSSKSVENMEVMGV